jgi:regulator of chromosome condensation
VTVPDGRAVRQRQYADGMLLLNYQTYQWAKKLLHPPDTDTTTTTKTSIADDSFYTGVVENYVLRASELRRRYDRDYGDVIVFGDGDCGQLGCGEAVSESRVPRILVGLRGTKIDMLACGGLHTIALLQDGTVVSWGCNDEGSLGWETSAEEGGNNGFMPNRVVGFIPSIHGPNGTTDDLLLDGGAIVPFANRKEAIITQVAAGETQSIALSSTGDVYTWGTYKDNEGRKFRSLPPVDDTRTPTGYKDMTNLEEDEDPAWYVAPRGNQDWPCHVIDMPNKAKDVSAGAAFNVALLVNGSIVTWGLGDCGELARPVPKMNKKTSNDIIIREYLTPRPPLWDGPATIGIKRSVVTISAGGYHLLVVTRDCDGELNVYSSGLNNYGQLGHGDITNRDKLTKIQHFVGREIVKVEGGMHFSCFVDKSSKELYACGRGDYGNLGITLEQPDAGYCVTLPLRVPLVHEPDIKSIIELNIDRKANCIIVEDIVETDQPEIEQISCGSTHVLVLTKGGDAYSWGFGQCGACGQGKSDQDVLRPRKLVPRLTSKATTTTTDGYGGGTTGGGDGACGSTSNTMVSAACKIQYVSGGGQHSAAIVKTGSTGFAL